EAAVHELDLAGALPERTPGEELLEEHTRLETSEVRAQAEVLPEAQGDVRLDGAREVEPIGVLTPDRLVAIGRGVEHHHRIAGPDRPAVHLGVPGGAAEEVADRRRHAEKLLDRIRERHGSRAQQIELVRLLEQEARSLSDQRARGLVS